MKEFGDKIPADKKQPIDDALAELKTAYEAEDKNIEQIEAAVNKLNEVFQAASQEMYNAQQEAGGEANGAAGDASTSNEDGDDEVTDVDFEEVDEDKK